MKKDEPHLPETADKSRHFRCSPAYASSMLTALHIVSTTPLYHVCRRAVNEPPPADPESINGFLNFILLYQNSRRVSR